MTEKLQRLSALQVLYEFDRGETLDRVMLLLVSHRDPAALIQDITPPARELAHDYLVRLKSIRDFINAQPAEAIQ